MQESHKGVFPHTIRKVNQKLVALVGCSCCVYCPVGKLYLFYGHSFYFKPGSPVQRIWKFCWNYLTDQTSG